MSVNEVGAALVDGILAGSVYSLIALGIVLVYRASGVFNFAQAEFGTTALFAGYVAVVEWGWNHLLGLGFALAVAVAVGLATERLIIHPLRDSSRVTLLVATAGVALLLVGWQFWRFNELPIREMPRIVDGVFATPFGAAVTYQQLITVVVLIGVALALAAFFKSPTGLAVQAAQQEPTAAELVGISTRRVSMLTWGIAALLGGLAGVLSGPNITFTAAFLTFGQGAALLPGFTAAVLAGMRSMPGALLGGLTVGVVQQIGSLGALSDVHGSGAIALFAFLLLVLLVRPQGVFVREKVAA